MGAEAEKLTILAGIAGAGVVAGATALAVNAEIPQWAARTLADMITGESAGKAGIARQKAYEAAHPYGAGLPRPPANGGG